MLETMVTCCICEERGDMEGLVLCTLVLITPFHGSDREASNLKVKVVMPSPLTNPPEQQRVLPMR